MKKIDFNGLKLTSGNTPIRGRVPNTGTISPIRGTRPLNNKENTTTAATAHAIDIRTLSPNKLNATRKPFIKPELNPTFIIGGGAPQAVKSPSAANIAKTYCANHPGRQEQFRCVVDGQDLGSYCSKCAAQLASQGFRLERVGGNIPATAQILMGGNNKTVTNHNFGKRKTSAPTLFNLPQSKSTRDIQVFLDCIKDVQQQLQSNNRTLSSLQEHYSSQLQIVDQFYQELVSHIEELHAEHSDSIKAQSRRMLQLALLEVETNTQNLSEIEFIVDDIESNLGVIVNLSEDKIRQCLDNYNRQTELYRHRAEQQQIMLAEIADLDVNNLGGVVAEFKKKVSALLNAELEERQTTIANRNAIKPQLMRNNNNLTIGNQVAYHNNAFNNNNNYYNSNNVASGFSFEASSDISGGQFQQQPIGIPLGDFFKKRKQQQNQQQLSSECQEQAATMDPDKKSPFRNLFEEGDSSSNNLPDESPSFKPF